MKLVPLCRTLRVVAAFGLAFTGIVLFGQPVPAQEAAKGAPARPGEVYQLFRSHISEGKYDIAALFLQSFLDSAPTDQDLLDIEAKHGTTVFRQLRTIPRWTDDPKLEKKTRENIEMCNAKRGQRVINCIGHVLARMELLNAYFTFKQVPPDPQAQVQLTSFAVQASKIVNKPKAEALQVLNRVLVTARSLATKSSSNVAPAFNSAAEVFARAIDVIEHRA